MSFICKKYFCSMNQHKFHNAIFFSQIFIWYFKINKLYKYFWLISSYEFNSVVVAWSSLSSPIFWCQSVWHLSLLKWFLSMHNRNIVQLGLMKTYSWRIIFLYSSLIHRFPFVVHVVIGFCYASSLMVFCFSPEFYKK